MQKSPTKHVDPTPLRVLLARHRLNKKMLASRAQLGHVNVIMLLNGKRPMLPAVAMRLRAAIDSLVAEAEQEKQPAQA